MMRRYFRCIAIAWLLTLAAPALAQSGQASSGDPCAREGGEARFTHVASIHIERDTAMFMIKHMQLACERIDSVIQREKPATPPAQVKALQSLVRRIQREILAPLYDAYPEFRGRNLSNIEVKRPECGCAKAEQPNRSQPLSYAAAQRFARILDDMVFSPIASNDNPSDCKAEAVATCGNPKLDIVMELGFASEPIYAAYPDLWKFSERRSERAFPPPARTAESDAAFRKAKAVAGRLQLTPAAIDYIRSYDDEIRGDGLGCYVNIITWALGSQTKGPDDKGWKSLPPGVMIGSYWCRSVPPDAVQTVSGLRIIVDDSYPERFAGRIVDFKKGKFVLEDR